MTLCRVNYVSFESKVMESLAPDDNARMTRKIDHINRSLLAVQQFFRSRDLQTHIAVQISNKEKQ